MVLLWLLFLSSVLCGEPATSPKNFEMTIDNGVLKSISQLERADQLDLSNLGIEDIDADAFDNLKIKFLNLQNNKLTLLYEGMFSELKGLEVLDLGSNRIRRSDNGFVGLDSLKVLNMSHNPVDYLMAGELHGIPKSADVLTKGNKLWSLSTRIFLETLEMDESEVHNDEEIDFETSKVDQKVSSRDLESWEHEMAQLAEESHVALKVDLFIKDSKPALDHDVFVELCMENGIVSSISVLEEGKELGKGCSKIVIESGIRYLNLQHLGIKGFLKGWYQLGSIPVVCIDLVHNMISEITEELLNDLPSEIFFVDLSGNLIRQVKNNTVRNEHLKLLSLKHNGLEDIEDGAFENTKLWGLYLSGNKLALLTCLWTFPETLTELFLNDNQILYIPVDAFVKLNSLVELSLGGNSITGIQKNVFRGLVALQTLGLSRNRISKIEEGFLLGLTSLTRLFLNDNQISGCVKGTFKGADSLRDLNLDRNKFSEVTKDSFANLPGSLESLSLDFNEIAALEDGSFIGVPKEKLNLNHNKISVVLPSFFDIKGLKHLYLKSNLIIDIGQDTFNGLPGLGHLWLADNKISELPKGVARNLSSLIIFDISKNPINELKNGALFGLPKDKRCNVYISDNQIELIQGGVFEDV